MILNRMKVVPVSEALGVELVDFDITRPPSPDEQAELRALFCEHHLLLVRGQDVTAEDQSRFVGSFGPLHTRSDGMQETFVTNVSETGEPPRTGTARLIWHQDGTYGLRPGIATSLWAQDVAPDAVPTMYASAVRALDRMPADLRARIEPLHVVHLRNIHEERTDYRWREENIPADAAPGQFLRHEHPIVYPMPHTDQQTILVNELLTSHVVELPLDEGEALIQELFVADLRGRQRVHPPLADERRDHLGQPRAAALPARGDGPPRPLSAPAVDRRLVHRRRPARLGGNGRRVRGLRQEIAVADEVRVGIIGTGFGATNVAPAFEVAKDCTVVDIVTPRDDAAVAALCARDDVDVISVHSPPFLHLTHVRRAIDAGHAVLCDKPFGLNADEAAAMTDLAREAEIVNLLNFERRFDPGRERLRELVRDGAVGEPSHFQYTRLLAVPGLPWTWLFDRSLGGGWLGGQGSHLIDCCRWLFGSEIVDANAVMRITMPERADKDGQMHPCDAEDGFVATLKTENGVTGVIDAAIGAAVTTAEHTVVFGTTGMLQIDGEQVVLRKADGDVETHDVDMQGKTPLVLSMERWAERVCDAVRSGSAEPDWPTFDDGLACAVVMDQMGRSATART